MALDQQTTKAQIYQGSGGACSFSSFTGSPTYCNKGISLCSENRAIRL